MEKMNGHEEKQELDVFDYHELMDRVCSAGQIFENMVCNHQVLDDEGSKDLLDLVEKISDLLGNAYQMAAELMMSKLDEEPSIDPEKNEE